MRARTRRSLTAASLLYLVALGVAFARVPLSMFNGLLIVAVGPWLWLIWVFCRASAHQHAAKWARAIDKVHGGRPRPLPERVR